MNSNKVLIVVDMQSDFVDRNGGLTISPALGEFQTKLLIKNISEHIKSFEGDVVYTLDTHLEDSCEFNSFPDHCIKNTDGWKLTDKVCEAIEFKEREQGALIKCYQKSTFSSSQLAEDLLKYRDKEPETEFEIVGVCTHICVHDIATSLVNRYKEFFNEVPRVTIHKNLVGDFDPEMSEFTLKRLSNLYGVKVA